jgi:hypothetical protein
MTSIRPRDPAEFQENPTYLAPSACVPRWILGTNACSTGATSEEHFDFSIESVNFPWRIIHWAPLNLPTPPFSKGSVTLCLSLLLVRIVQLQADVQTPASPQVNATECCLYNNNNRKQFHEGTAGPLISTPAPASGTRLIPHSMLNLGFALAPAQPQRLTTRPPRTSPHYRRDRQLCRVLPPSRG